MKKFLLSALLTLSMLTTMAQEVEGEVVEVGKWSTETKQVILAVFTAFILILVARAFRNKPTA